MPESSPQWKSDKPWIVGDLNEAQKEIRELREEMVSNGDLEKYERKLETLNLRITECERQIWKWGGALIIISVILPFVMQAIALLFPLLRGR